MALTDLKPAVVEAETNLEPKLVADAAKLEAQGVADMNALVDHFLDGLKELVVGREITISIK